MPPPLPTLMTERLRIEHAQPRFARAHADFFARNREFFSRWDPPRPPGMETANHWRIQLRRALKMFAEGRSVRLVLFLRDAGDELMIGRVNLSQIERGAFQSCMLGYQIDALHEGRGLMAEALRATIDYAFGTLRLHRIQANYQPENERSGRLLERLGFQREGLAPAYLYIDGAWRDHVLTALLNPEFDVSLLDQQVGRT